MIENPVLAKRYLKFIGYYRLSGYGLPFRQQDQSSHDFLPGTTFEDILTCYTFDRKLRLHINDAVERIEVAVRSLVSDTMSLKYGSHWFMDEGHFIRERFNHEKFLETLTLYLRQSQDLDFIQHYGKKYEAPSYPPSWMVFEILPFGSVSFVYRKLKQQSDRKEMCASFQIYPRLFESWIHSISYLRNLCAHHSRVWNNVFTIKPEIAKKHRGILTENNRLYAQMVVIQELLQVISPGSRWAEKLQELFEEYPNLSRKAMGFPADWHQQPFWNMKINSDEKL